MASIIIREALVERMIGNKGFSCSTSYTTRQGEEKKQYFTVWADNLDHVREGQKYDIRGLLSARLEEWDDKNTGEKRQRAAIHVNQPKITPPKTEDFAGYDEKRATQAELRDVWPEAKQLPDNIELNLLVNAKDEEAPF